MVMLPSVVLIAPAGFRFRLRPALSSTLPLVVVTAALTLTSRPQHTTKFPLVAVTAWLTFTSRSAFSVKVVALGLAVQLTASLTLISPLPVVAVLRVVTGGVPATVASGPVCVVIVTLLVTSRAESVAPLMLSVAPPPMMKSCGSISQVPVCPWCAAVVTRAVSRTLTCAAEVSMKPPLPPCGALASSVPPTSHRAGLHSAHQLDHAIAGRDRLRLDHPGVVHDAGQQAARGLRGEQDVPAVGLDQQPF